MKKKQILQIVCFNIALIAVNIICFSSGFLNLLSYNSNPLNLAINITIIFMTIISFFYINYKLLTSNNNNIAKPDYNLEKLDSHDEYIDVLNQYSYKTLFLPYIDEAIDQIERIGRKHVSLEKLLYQKFKKNDSATTGYKDVIKDANTLLFKNIKRLITLVSIFDQQEYDDLMKRYGSIPATKKQLYDENDHYVKSLMWTNEEILLNYDKLISEISKIGDTSEADEINLRRISDIISNMKTLRTNENDDLMKKYES